jgi:hypothetical protein
MITTLLILTILNVLFACLNYKKENYRAAMISSFAAGFCLADIIL